uniref:CSON005996 protein n=1 Tax=Culicoides sonorensis TaxID=179676 RepID=A0A336LIP4_CULSO
MLNPILFVTLLIIFFSIRYVKMIFRKPKNLRDQIVLITGGANGLGKEIALQLSRLGCKIAIADLDIANAEKTVQEILLEGNCKHAKAYKIDVSSLSEIEQLKLNMKKDLGSVDIVINNAALLFVRPIDEENPVILQKMIDVNVMSLVWTTRVFLQDFIEQKRGHIVTISSIAGFLHIDLYRNKLGKHIKTTTVFPYFINTGNVVKEHTQENYRHTVILSTRKVAKRVIEGIKFNERIVTIPSIAYIFGYKIQIPMILYKMYIRHMTVHKEK